MLREDYTPRYNRGRDLQDIALELDAISTNLSVLGYAIVDGAKDSTLTAEGVDNIIFSICQHLDRVAEEIDDRSISYR